MAVIIGIALLIGAGIGIWIMETRAAKNDETMPETIDTPRDVKTCDCAFPDNWRDDGICEGCGGLIL